MEEFFAVLAVIFGLVTIIAAVVAIAQLLMGAG